MNLLISRCAGVTALGSRADHVGSRASHVTTSCALTLRSARPYYLADPGLRSLRNSYAELLHMYNLDGLAPQH